MVSDVPMIRELGAGRAQLDTAEELSRIGHSVTTFDPRDAFRHRPRLHPFRPMQFASRARGFVRDHAPEFDVIDGLQACLPYSKHELRFGGLLVVRSTGLHPLYREYLEYERRHWPDRLPGSPTTRALYRWRDGRIERAGWRTYEVSDVIRVLNPDESKFFDRYPSLLGRVVEIPEGLPDSDIEALALARLDSPVRLARREVVVVGAWSLRKGAAEWPDIVRSTRALVPDACFRFLGTGVPAELVRQRFGQGAGIEVIEHYSAAELPALLRTASVGALPSHIEGYSLGILEQLASGVPSVAYDVPGPRTILQFESSLLVPRGDSAAFAKKLGDILLMSPQEHIALAGRCMERANQHRLSGLIARLATVYEERLARLRSRERR